MILFIIFYLIVGITLAKSNKQLEEQELTNLECYVLIPLFWFYFLIRDTYFNNYEE